MRRYIVVFLAVALALGVLAPAQAKKKKKPKPKPVNVTYNVVWQEACVFSVKTELANPDQSCGDPFAGSTTGAVAEETTLSSGEPIVISAVDGVPLRFDASKTVQGNFNFGSYTLAALADQGLGQPLGVGEAEFQMVLTGTSKGTDVVIGEVTTEPYAVTPGTGDYAVSFEITPSQESSGKVFDALSLSFEQVGSATVHGALSADATSTLTLGAFKKK
jgi:hypothetical protein